MFPTPTGTAYFNSKHGCPKCNVIGIYSRVARRVSFPNFSAQIRTDTSFRDRCDPLHHNERSPLEDITLPNSSPFLDMIKDFPTSDSLHLLEEGVMKRCLNTWLNKSSNFMRKLTSSQKCEIDKLIIYCNKELSSDINREVRILQYIRYYKATEFRTILLYSGMVIFKDVLDNRIYTHFLKLCLAVRLCYCKTYVKQKNCLSLARKLFSEFCTNYVTIYGEDSIVSNIHNVIHIVDDVEYCGPLNDVSTYPFENYLREIKSNVAPSKEPIVQIVNRIAEITLEQKIGDFDIKKMELDISKWLPKLKYPSDESGVIIFKFIQITPNVHLSTKKCGDRWFLTKFDDLVEMKYARQIDQSYFISGSKIKYKTDFFLYPYSSHYTNIYLTNGDRADGNLFYNIRDITAKMMCLSYGNHFVFMPVLHSLDEFAIFL